MSQSMFALHVAISPIYILFMLSLIFGLRQVHIILRVLLASGVLLTIVAISAIIERLDALLAGVFTLVVIFLMLIVSMILLYPVAEKILPSILGLPENPRPFNLQRILKPDLLAISKAAEQSRLLSLYKNEILIFQVGLSIVN